MEQTKHKGNIGMVLGSLVIGGLIGAGIALLSAPQSGYQTRAMLREKGSEYRGRIKSTALETRSRINSGWMNVQQRADTIVRRFNHTAPETVLEGD